jgi:hypothetical protein
MGCDSKRRPVGPIALFGTDTKLAQWPRLADSRFADKLDEPCFAEATRSSPAALGQSLVTVVNRDEASDCSQ